jgi:hypothetical protein
MQHACAVDVRRVMTLAHNKALVLYGAAVATDVLESGFFS